MLLTHPSNIPSFHYSLAQTLAQTGIMGLVDQFKHVAPGRAGQANWGEALNFNIYHQRNRRASN